MIDGSEKLRDVNFFFLLKMRLQLLVSLQRMALNLMLIQLTGESPTRNLQINSMLLTSTGWKLLSTKPLIGSVPLRKAIKKNRRNLEAIAM